MITTLTIATLSPFMVADAQEKVANMPQENIATYNWRTQTVDAGIDTEDVNTGMRASFSFIPGGGGAQTVDDWNLV